MPTASGMPMPLSGVESFMKGIDTGSSMFQRMMQPEIARLQREQQMQMHKDDLAAKKRGQDMLAQRSGLLHPSGDVANAMYVEQLRNQFGEDDPRYIEAKRAHQMQLDARQSLMGYRQQLSDTAPFRATSPLGKAIAEGQRRGPLDMLGVNQNYDALGQKVTGQKNAPYDAQKARAYEMDIAKKTTDADARKRYNFAVNIDKTRERINPQDLLAYSGLEGAGRYLKDQAIAQSRNPPPQLLAHQQALSGANLLAKQVRQFYGESIQPAMEKKLEKITNPATWYKNPKLALAEYNAFNDILDAETQTYKDMGTSPIKLRQPQNDQQQQADPSSQQSSNNDELDFATAISPQLIDALPQATPENILQTAKDTGKTVNEVVQFLINKRDQMMQGGQ